MRLFVAIDISDDSRRAFRRAREELQARLLSRTPPRFVWVGDDAAHITLRFIGAVPDAQAVLIEEALRPALDLSPFDLELSTLGTFPPGRSPRVVWMGATSDLEPMRQLARLVNGRIDPIVPNQETRPYTPHLTVARVKDPGGGVDWVGALGRVTPEPTRSRVDHVTLYESRVTSNPTARLSDYSVCSLLSGIGRNRTGVRADGLTTQVNRGVKSSTYTVRMRSPLVAAGRSRASQRARWAGAKPR